MKLLGYPFTDLPLEALGRHVRAGMSGARMAIYCPLNAALISGAAGDPAKKAIVDAADVVILDSRFVGRLARLIGLATPHVVAGSDLTVHLLDHVLTREDRVCFVVAGPEVVAALKARYDLPHAVYVTPKYGLARDPAEIERLGREIAASGAALTFFGIGFPQQEMLAAAVRAAGGRGVGLCTGASLQFATGLVERAPVWMREAGLEWLHRFMSEPRRLFRRYVVESTPILGMLLRERFARRP